MTNPIPNNDKLPVEYALKDALKIYLKRFGIFFLIVLVNIFLFSSILVFRNIVMASWIAVILLITAPFVLMYFAKLKINSILRKSVLRNLEQNTSTKVLINNRHRLSYGVSVIMYKRVLDLFLAFSSMPIFFPLMIFIAMFIKIDSPGPVFYRQVVIGDKGKPFSLLKFRTMRVNKIDGNKSNLARVTRVGQFLRKTSLDTFPQLLNILRGEMSFIGPNPIRSDFHKLFLDIPYYSNRFQVKPGLVSLASVDSSLNDSLDYDLYYVFYWSVWLDIYIFMRSIESVLGFNRKLDEFKLLPRFQWSKLANNTLVDAEPAKTEFSDTNDFLSVKEAFRMILQGDL